MRGFNWLRRRYRRFRYHNLSRFPRLFVIFDMATLPMQILLVAVPLWIAVGFYDDNFSYRAKSDRADRERTAAGEGAIVTEANPVVVIERRENLLDSADNLVEVKSAAVASIDNVPPLSSDEPVARGEQPDGSTLGNAQDKLSELNSTIARIAGPGASHLAESASNSAESLRLREASWLGTQADTSYVIQFESSENVERMRREAYDLPTTGELAIYPYKVSRDGEIVYGLSYGLYESLTAAKAANAELPVELRRYGSWIRRVGHLKKQIDNLDPLSTNNED